MGELNTNHPYRTVCVALVGMATLLLGLLICGRWPLAVSCYPTFAGSLGICVSAVAAKAYGEHKAKAHAGAPGAPP